MKDQATVNHKELLLHFDMPRHCQAHYPAMIVMPATNAHLTSVLQRLVKWWEQSDRWVEVHITQNRTCCSTQLIKPSSTHQIILYNALTEA